MSSASWHSEFGIQNNILLEFSALAVSASALVPFFLLKSTNSVTFVAKI
jgi:hypothetical protein